MDSTEKKGETPIISKKKMELITRGDELDNNILTQAMELIMKIKPELKIQPTSLSQCPQLLQHYEGKHLLSTTQEISTSLHQLQLVEC